MKTQVVGGVRMALVDRGQGMSLLLIHGFPLDHSMWSAQIDALADRYRVIAPDLRGFGASSGGDDTVTMERYADDLAALLDAIGVTGPVVVCGLSMGGYITWQFWCKYSYRVRALVLCDTRAVADSPEAAAGRLETARRVLREGPGLLAETMLPKLLAPRTAQEQPALVERLRGLIERGNPQGIAAALRGMAQRPDVSDRLPEITCPTLVVVGHDDAISTPQEMGAIARAIPDARLVEIAGSGHMTPVERPEQFTAALGDFLAALESS